MKTLDRLHIHVCHIVILFPILPISTLCELHRLRFKTTKPTAASVTNVTLMRHELVSLVDFHHEKHLG